MPDHALVIDDVVGRRAAQVPASDDGGARVRERSPGQLLLVHHEFEFLRLVPADIYTDQGEGFLFEVLDERPLMGPLGPSGASGVVPEVEQHDLATVIAQLEALAVLVLSLDIRRLLTDGQVAEL